MQDILIDGWFLCRVGKIYYIHGENYFYSTITFTQNAKAYKQIVSVYNIPM